MSYLGKKTPLVGVLGLLGAALVIWWGVKHFADPEKVARKQITLQVKVVKPKRGGMERTTTQSGTLHSFEHVEVFPKVSGVLMNQKVDIETDVRGMPPWFVGGSSPILLGSPFGQGPFLVSAAVIYSRKDILAEIDAPELLQDELQAVASLEKAKAQVQQMEAQLVARKAEVEYKIAENKRAKAYLNFRQKRYHRYAELAMAEKGEKPIIPKDFLDEEQDKLEAAQSARDSAKAGVNFAEAKVIEAGADLGAAKANQRVAAAALEKAHVFVDFTKIRSPLTGRITKRNFHNGDFIRSPDKGGTKPLYIIQRTDKMRLIVQIPDSDVPYADRGDAVDLEIEALSGEKKFRGLKISRIASSEDERTRTMRVEIDILNKKRNGVYLLRDGMYGMVTIHLENGAANAFTVPSRSLHKNGKQTLLYVVREGRTRILEVRVPNDNGQNAEILPETPPTPKDLRASDMIILDHSGPLQEGLRVNTVEVKEGEGVSAAQ